MQVAVGEVADVVQDHRVMTVPVEVDHAVGPGVGALDLGDARDLALAAQLRIAREEPDHAVALEHRKSLEGDLELLAEVVVGHVHQAAFAVVGPAVIGAAQGAAFDLSQGELEIAMGAAVLHGAHGTVLTAEDRERAMPEHHLLHAAHGQVARHQGRIPVVRIHARNARSLAEVVGLFETWRCGLVVSVVVLPHGGPSLFWGGTVLPVRSGQTSF